MLIGWGDCFLEKFNKLGGLESWRLGGCRLEGCRLEGCRLGGCGLGGCRLEGYWLEEGWKAGAKCVGRNMHIIV